MVGLLGGLLGWLLGGLLGAGATRRRDTPLHNLHSQATQQRMPCNGSAAACSVYALCARALARHLLTCTETHAPSLWPAAQRVVGSESMQLDAGKEAWISLV